MTKENKLPSNWEIKRINQIGSVSSGGTPDTDNEIYWNGSINWCTPTDITKLKDGKYIGNTIVKITEAGLKNSSAKLLPKGAIIVCTRATIGKVAIATEEISTNQGFKNIIPNKEFDGDYIYYSILNSEQKLQRLGNGSTFLEVSKSDFEIFSLPFPQKAEQTAIANLLSTWDEAIQKTNTLIEQKQNRKKWLMQMLLTGKKRLKGFEKEKWKEVRLGEVFDERNDTGNFNLPLLSVGAAGIYPQSDSIKKDTSNEDKSKYRKICVGDIGYNTMRMWQGRSALSSLEGIISPAYTVVTPKSNSDAKYYSFLFKTPHLINAFYRNSQGLVDDTLNCKYKDFAIVKTFVPPTKKEQEEIAKVLVLADKEIGVLHKKLDQLNEQKKGLMQILLTGKKRLKVN